MTTEARIAGTPAILEVSGLDVDFWVDGQWYPAAVDLEYDVKAGEILAIVGESGSGKSSSSMALLGLTPPNGRVAGSAKLLGRELIGMSGTALRRVRGRDIAVIFQEPMTALNPVYSIGFQIVETLRTHFDMSPSEAKARAIELLDLVEMPTPELTFDKYPHQLSGGQRQRAMIAMSVSCDPKLLIADEPTTALDVTVQAEILELLRNLRDRLDSAIVLITHDMGVVADLADKVIVMKDGRIVESGSVEQIFHAPTETYTQQLLASVPHLRLEGEVSTALQTDMEGGVQPYLSFRNVAIEYPKRGRIPAFRAAENIDIDVYPGEIVGLVGESGSGKTTLGRAAVGLLPVAEGELLVGGHNLAAMSSRQLRAARKEIGIVFQDPGSSLNPRFPIGQSIGEPLMLATGTKGDKLDRVVESLLDQVELPRSFRNRYPHELSGGQRQRVGIARALALRPKLLVADEPTSALDVSVQARFLVLLQELQREMGFACLFVSHDLAVVDQLADRIVVMHRGHIVEQGSSDQILRSPQEAYTQRLLAAVPLPDPAAQRSRREERIRLLGTEEADGSAAS
ncbi:MULTISPECIES: ABC transporter ATP-binding protein [unclassified Leifsonia]|uniref:dipeptide ABC transporter ATP-binding protein n=1 Tax=unclassified Leifsonia TaxID=2663824 RepID=UPI0008A7B3BA|nr:MULTISPECIES: ABC transporter ATP-binding protein [unclassified Leifsonia]SEH90852.1 peptide/nickel transport system ATP-binding protein [Leifsonia sp. CL154]SFL53239.1 peptide/nickel transport system ATP-binding protein [Leifsonia sp. CL147]